MLLSRLGIRSRIYGGMGILVLLGIALAGQGVRQLSAIDRQVLRMSTLSDGVSRVLRIAGLVETTRRASLQFKTSATPAALEQGDAADAQIVDLLQASANDTQSPERARTYAAIAAGATEYHELRGELTGLTRAVVTGREQLFRAGDRMTAATLALVASAQTSTDLPSRTAARNVETAILRVRVASLQFLATGDAGGLTNVKATIEAAIATLNAITKLTLSEDESKLVAPVGAALTSYADSFATLSGNILKSDVSCTKSGCGQSSRLRPRQPGLLRTRSDRISRRRKPRRRR